MQGCKTKEKTLNTVFGFKSSSKGISPIIAVVLLLGITISVAALVPSWFSGTLDSLTQGTSNQSQQILQGAGIDLEIAQASYSSPSNMVELSVQLNTEENINTSFNAIAFCNGQLGGSESFQAENGLNNINFTSSCEPERIEVALENYPRSTSTDQLNVQGFSTWTINNLQNIVDVSNNIFYQPLTLERNQDNLEETSFDGQKINTTVDNGEIRLEN